MKSLVLTFLLLSFGMIGVAQEKALNYKELQKVLPSSINGYNLSGDIDGSSFEMNDMSYSVASASYEKGDSELNISIMDYQGAKTLYMSASMAWSAGMKYEDDEQEAHGVDYENAKGWLVNGKVDNTSELVLGYKERYIITISITETSNNTAESIYKSLNLKSLP